MDPTTEGIFKGRGVARAACITMLNYTYPAGNPDDDVISRLQEMNYWKEVESDKHLFELAAVCAASSRNEHRYYKLNMDVSGHVNLQRERHL
ncbi:hypothetical protein PHYPO_G00129900 [Pangasianodon hypophthalmus]|uniref:Uncharacterized protein n=1 Tax=Pangasianodon hypophthalmus TaxID=310915 RepID=A0A5N5KSB6_PANHP|nr:hypothetical protein PHYPO_G00129900 [Pangasianodon hypophthalmus]